MQDHDPAPEARTDAGTEAPDRPQVRRATAADLETLTALEAACFDAPWSAAALAAEVAHQDAILLLAEGVLAQGATKSGGAPRPLGYATYRAAAGEAELLRLAVLPEARRQGVATALLETGDAALAAAGVRVCFLEVRADNRAALAFYRAAGFHRIGQRPRYYRDREDALLFARSVGPSADGPATLASAAPEPG